MGTTTSEDPAALEAGLIHRQLGALTDASAQRHRLVPGSAEYEAALRIEQQLADNLWHLATDLGPESRDREPANRPEP